MPQRTIAISDIHGCYDELMVLLESVKYDKDKDKLITLGDYVDRGTQSKQVLSFLAENPQIIKLAGNHDRMMVNAITNDSAEKDSIWINNGGLLTLISYVGTDFFSDAMEEEGNDLYYAYKKSKELFRKVYMGHIDFINTFDYTYNDEYGNLFVHAGINPYISIKNQSVDDLIWIRELFLHNKNDYEGRIIFGHTPVGLLHNSEAPWRHENKIGIDGGCAYGKQLNALIMEDGMEKSYAFVRRGEGKNE